MFARASVCLALALSAASAQRGLAIGHSSPPSASAQRSGQVDHSSPPSVCEHEGQEHPLVDLREVGRDVGFFRVVDLDGDSHQDVVFKNSDAIYWAKNDGLGNFTEQRIIGGTIAQRFAVGRIDNDERVDIVFAGALAELYALRVDSIHVPPGCAAEHSAHLGDSYCDNGSGNTSNYNTAECEWDRGDCCASTCVDSVNTCGANNGFDCEDPDASSARARPSPRHTAPEPIAEYEAIGRVTHVEFAGADQRGDLYVVSTRTPYPGENPLYSVSVLKEGPNAPSYASVLRSVATVHTEAAEITDLVVGPLTDTSLPDVVIRHLDSEQRHVITILLNQRDGSFVVGGVHEGLPPSGDIAFGDANGDGQNDILFERGDANSGFRYLLNEGGSFSLATLPLEMPAGPSHNSGLLMHDLDKDGRLDALVLTESASPAVLFFRQVSAHEFKKPRDLAACLVDVAQLPAFAFGGRPDAKVAAAAAAVVADFNGDGVVDVALRLGGGLKWIDGKGQWKSSSRDQGARDGGRSAPVISESLILENLNDVDQATRDGGEHTENVPIADNETASSNASILGVPMLALVIGGACLLLLLALVVVCSLCVRKHSIEASALKEPQILII